MKKILLITIISATALMFTGCSNKNKNTLLENEVQTELTIWGMTCVSCVNRIESTLSELDGIKSVKVDLENEKAIIIHDKELDVKMIKNTITRLGYNVP